MFFQVNVTPEPKKRVELKCPKESEEVSVLSLAHFTANPKIFFEDIKVGKSATRLLNIKNPTQNDVELFLTKIPPEERCVVFNWNEVLIEASGEVILEINWKPTKEGAWRDTISLEDGKRIKKDVPISFKSIQPKVATSRTKIKPKPIIKKNKSPTKILKKRTSPTKYYSPKKISPVKKYKSPQKSRQVLKPKPYIPAITIESPKRSRTYYLTDKENFNIHFHSTANESNIKDSPSGSTFIIDHKNKTFDHLLTDSVDANATFEDSLENISPPRKSPLKRLNNILTNAHTPLFATKIKNMEFTPELKIQFSPSVYSTGEKSLNSIDYSLKEKCLNISSDTYINGNKSSDAYVKGNKSSDTYVKDNSLNSSEGKENLSGDTYIKGNLSGDTYIKANLSSGTYIKDDSIGDIGALTSPISKKKCPNLSPIACTAKHVIEANLWCEDRVKKPLSMIVEESMINHSTVTPTKCFNIRKRKSNVISFISPSKKPTTIIENKPTESKLKEWSKRAVTNKVKISKGLNLKDFIEKSKANQQKFENLQPLEVLHQPDNFLSNPYLLASTNEIDPFMSATLYYEPRWMDEQELRFKKWLNALLTPPEELSTNTEGNPVDVSKLWQECKRREVNKPLSKEEISNKLHVKGALDTLRKNAVSLFQSPSVSQVLAKSTALVENNSLVIRQDRDIHLDLSLQYEVMSLFLSYNPLWLRIGLEVVFGFKIPLNSNSDVLGLSTFIMQYFFKDPYLLKKYKAVHAKNYSEEIKKHILKKFLLFVYFLDHAKNLKLIPHDPCLFCKKSQIKESKEILLKFSSLLLQAIGDITKRLRLTGYVLTHKQVYIHEFEYAIDNLGVDLRDGIRLARVMEIILLRDDLTNNLRVPTISRLQKIHNMKMVFDALNNSNYTIIHEITPKDIVDGHREKTLSFLWQIIFKFQGPRFMKAVVTVQSWWNSLGVVVKRRILEKEHKRKIEAATLIQHWYRRSRLVNKLERFIPLLLAYLKQIKENKAAVKIQSYYKMSVQRRQFLKTKRCVIGIQTYTRKWLVMYKVQVKLYAIIKIQSVIRCCLKKKRFLQLKAATLFIEEKYIANKLAKRDLNDYLELKYFTTYIQTKFRANLLMKTESEKYNTLKHSAIVIQRRYRAKVEMQKCFNNYQSIQCAVLNIQRWFRSVIVMKKQHKYYKELKHAAIIIQHRFRANASMRMCLERFNSLKSAAIIIQRRWRALLVMRKEQNSYNEIKSAVLLVQRRYRANINMQKCRDEYNLLKKSVINVQIRFRALRAMRKQKEEYSTARQSAILIQRKFRANRERTLFLSMRNAAIVLQRRFRARCEMCKCFNEYRDVRMASLVLQRRFRALVSMRKEKRRFGLIKWAAIKMQSNYKGNTERKKYLRVQGAVILIQRLFRAKIAMKKCLGTYQELKNATISIQRRYRSLILMRKERENYVLLRKVTIKLQSIYKGKTQRAKYLKMQDAAKVLQCRFRAKIAMQRSFASYQELKKAAITIQRQYRAQILMRRQRENYILLRKATIKLQSSYKAKKQREYYLKLQNAATVFQRRFRAKIAMKKSLASYQQLKKAAITVQRQYRALILMKQQSENYILLRKVTIKLQSTYKAKKQRKAYLELKQAVKVFQRRFRAKIAMRNCVQSYRSLKKAAIVFQRKYKALVLMRQEKQRFILLKQTTIKLQANLRRKQQRQSYLKLKEAAVVFQERFRAKIAMQNSLRFYQTLRKSSIDIQRRFRAQQSMKLERNSYLTLKRAAVVIQRKFRANKQRQNFLQIRKATLVFQRRYKAKRLMQLRQGEYQKLKEATINIQRRLRAQNEMKKCKESYDLMKRSSTLIQARFRGYRGRKEFEKMKNAAVVLQRRFKAKKEMELQRQKWICLRNSTIYIQNKFKANLQMKLQRDQYCLLKKAVVLCQQRFRATLAMKKQKNLFVEQKEATQVIQRYFRGYLTMLQDRKRFLTTRNLALHLQRLHRANIIMVKQRTEYNLLKKYVVIVQKRFRAQRLMKMKHNEYLLLKQTTIRIQRGFRANKLMRLKRREFLDLKEKVVKIQRYYRGYCEMKKEMVIYRRKLWVVLRMQALFRGVLVRRKCRILLDPVLAERRRAQMERKNSATLIQALWRGYTIRKEEKPEMKRIRKRIKSAEDKMAPEKTLGHRRDQAIKVLINDNSSLLQILRALQDIEYVTRRCKDTCYKMSVDLSQELFGMISSTGRSLPEMQTCTVATSILINFCKYSKSKENSWYAYYVEDFIKIMTHCCDKEGEQFPYMCTLLWLYAHNEECLKYIKSLPTLQQQMNKIKVLCERKEKMVAKGSYRGIQTNFAPYSKLPLPSLQPDWGIEYNNRPRVFTNSIHALKMLLLVLKIE